jgi:hypothetical protein
VKIAGVTIGVVIAVIIALVVCMGLIGVLSGR